ncbi:MAG: response regulator [Planctomycetaceae bacterium]|jgi:CheY-like chemotaxis protein
MAGKAVLSVGQCRPDSAAIGHYLRSNFAAEVVTADTAADALRLLAEREFQLVLLNRLLDADGSEGLQILHEIRRQEGWNGIPVMLVSNYAEWQQKAVAAGAVPGFGKAELNRPETRQRVAEALGI